MRNGGNLFRKIVIALSFCWNCCTSSPTLMDQIIRLDASGGLPEPLQEGVFHFTRTLMGMELPLYTAEFIQLQKHLNHLYALCTDTRSFEFVPVHAVQESLAAIGKLYPDILEVNEPGTCQLVDALLDNGIVKDDITAFHGLPPCNLLILLNKQNTMPIALFRRICSPLLKDESFREAFFYRLPHQIIGRSAPGFFDFWVMQAKFYLSDADDKHFQHCYQQALVKLIHGTPQLQTGCNSQLLEDLCNKVVLKTLEKACTEDRPSLITSHSQKSEFLLSRVMSFLTKNLETVSPLLTKLLNNLSMEQHQRLLLACFMFRSWPLMRILLEISPDMKSLTEWRDPEGKNLLHCGVRQVDFFLDSPGTVLEVLEDHPEASQLLCARDLSGKTPLESFFVPVRDLYIGEDFLRSPFIDMLERTLALTGLPWHCNELLSTVTRGHGFHAWLLVRLVQNGLDPRQLSVHQEANTFAQSFKDILCCFYPLLNTEQQAGFLTAARELGFCEDAAVILLKAFHHSLSRALFPPHFSPAERAIWESEVLPLPDGYIAGLATVKPLPWSPLLQQAMLCYTPAVDNGILHIWSESLRHMADQSLLNEYSDTASQSLPRGIHGIYGRSCYFSAPDGGKTLRLKFRKKQPGNTPEAWKDFASEPVKLSCLRKLQRSGQLPLKSHLPEPVGMYRISNFRQWLANSPLSREEQAELEKGVFVEENGSACVYIYQTQPSEQYHLYPYDDPEAGLEALKLAAHDLGLLARAGLAATVLPMYHDESGGRHYVILAQLCDHICPGTLDSWDDQATSFPNISPGVGIRDYADILPFSDLPLELERTVRDTPENRGKVHMEQIGREFLSLLLLLARTRGNQLDHRDGAAVRSLAQDILQISAAFFGQAFRLSAEVISNAMTTYGMADRLAREISFWCDSSEFPEWVDCLRNGCIPESVYPKTHGTEFDLEVGQVITDKGACDTTHSTGRNLGHRNGMFPLLEVNKLLTLAFTLSIHEEQARATFANEAMEISEAPSRQEPDREYRP